MGEGEIQNDTRRQREFDSERRRAQFQEDEGKAPGGTSRLPVLALAVGIGLLVIVLAMMLGVGRSQPSLAGSSGAGAVSAGEATRRAAGEFTTVTPDGGSIALNVADFADGKARFYTLKNGGKDIDFFVVRSKDGVIRAAIDSCDVCYQARRGYRQEGDEMVCNNCGQRFATNKINEVKGGCNPVPLERSVQGEQLIIDVDTLTTEGGRYF